MPTSANSMKFCETVQIDPFGRVNNNWSLCLAANHNDWIARPIIWFIVIERLHRGFKILNSVFLISVLLRVSHLSFNPISCYVCKTVKSVSLNKCFKIWMGELIRRAAGQHCSKSWRDGFSWIQRVPDREDKWHGCGRDATYYSYY